MNGGHDNGTFNLEFHIPYYAIRKNSTSEDTRTLVSKPLRKAWPLPIKVKQSEKPESYMCYEAKTSFLLIGSDDFCWTSICFADGPPGSEKLKSTYLSAAGGRGKDPATGGERTMEFPYWSPQEYFLVVLSRRMRAATKESINCIRTFDARLRTYVSSED